MEEMSVRADKTFPVVAALYKVVLASPVPTFRELLDKAALPAPELALTSFQKMLASISKDPAGKSHSRAPRSLSELGKTKDSWKALAAATQSTEPADRNDNEPDR